MSTKNRLTRNQLSSDVARVQYKTAGSSRARKGFRPSLESCERRLLLAADPVLSLAATPSSIVFGDDCTLECTATGTTFDEGNSSIVGPPGAIDFYSNGTLLGSAPLNGTPGSELATLDTTALTVGALPDTITCKYNAVTNESNLLWDSATAGPVNVTVNQASSTTTLVSSQEESTFGQSVTFTANVTPVTATGTVTFMDGSTALDTEPVSAGVATFSTTSLNTSSIHVITAVYSGDSNDIGSSSNVVPLLVDQATSTIALIDGTQSPSGSRGLVEFSASITPITATGTVTFMDGNTPIFDSPVVDGSVVFTDSAFSIGQHSITAVYEGDTNDTMSTSQAVTQTVVQNTTITTLVTSPSPSTFREPVTYVANVLPFGATGTVTFMDGTTAVGTAQVSEYTGNAVFATTTPLSAGHRTITAVYSGDADDAASTSDPVTQIVNQSGTDTILTSSPNPTTPGQPVALTAYVFPNIATGIVTFMDGTTVLGTATITGGLGGLESATFLTSTLAVGQHNITAVYGGDSNFTTSMSGAVAETIAPTTTATTISTSTSTSVCGQAIAITAKVSPATTTGTMTFMSGTTVLGTATISGGVATLSTAALNCGVSNIMAIYNGNSSFIPSTSSAVAETVNQASTSTAIQAIAHTVKKKLQSVTLQASVGVQAPGSGIPTGTVTFETIQKGKKQILGSCTLTNGTGSISVSSKKVLKMTVTALYSGDSNNTASTMTLNVNNGTLTAMEVKTTSVSASFVHVVKKVDTGETQSKKGDKTSTVAKDKVTETPAKKTAASAAIHHVVSTTARKTSLSASFRPRSK